MHFLNITLGIILCMMFSSTVTLWADDYACYLAKTCIHNGKEKCGVHLSSHRKFLDTCDLLEYNCLKKTEYKKTSMSDCDKESADGEEDGQGTESSNEESVTGKTALTEEESDEEEPAEEESAQEDPAEKEQAEEEPATDEPSEEDLAEKKSTEEENLKEGPIKNKILKGTKEKHLKQKFYSIRDNLFTNSYLVFEKKMPKTQDQKEQGLSKTTSRSRAYNDTTGKYQLRKENSTKERPTQGVFTPSSTIEKASSKVPK